MGDNGRMTTLCNIAASLPRLARERPDQIAIRCPGGRGANGMAAYDVTLSYAELDARSDAIAAGLALHGIGRGVRAVVMVRPSPEFFLLMFALFKAGAVPVLVDPGIDKRALKQCLDEAQPQAFIGIPLAQLARRLLRWAPSATQIVTVGGRYCWGGVTLARVERDGAGAGSQLADTAADDVAAILFTSGSTGVPKGVVYRHRHFVGQIELLRNAFDMQPGGVDLPTFPPFALFDPALGLTSVIPDMDPTRPATADPRKLHDAMTRFGVTQLFGSPALMRVLADYGQPLPNVRLATSAGAPVPPDVVAKIRALLPADAQFWTPYGATECLPVAAIEGRTLDATRTATEAGAGTCVGQVVAPNEVRIIAIDDAAIPEWSGVRVLAAGEVGEITVAGPTTTDTYFNRDAATRNAKIRELQRRQRARQAPHGRRWLFRCRGALVVLRPQDPPRGNRHRPALHRTGRADLQRASAGAAHRVGGCRHARSAATGAVRGVAARRCGIGLCRSGNCTARSGRCAPAHRRNCAFSAPFRLSGGYSPQRQDRPRKACDLGGATTCVSAGSRAMLSGAGVSPAQVSAAVVCFLLQSV